MILDVDPEAGRVQLDDPAALRRFHVAVHGRADGDLAGVDRAVRAAGAGWVDGAEVLVPVAWVHERTVGAGAAAEADFTAMIDFCASRGWVETARAVRVLRVHCEWPARGGPDREGRTAMPVDGPTTDIHLDPAVFRSIAGHFTTGVTVITATHAGRRYGSTASAFCSLSMEPPMALVCLNRSSRTATAVSAAGGFVVNILGGEQRDLAARFAGRDADKFADLPVREGRGGHPVLSGTFAHIECRVVERTVGGTHIVFLAEVAHGAVGDGEPLAYLKGRFGRFVELPAA